MDGDWLKLHSDYGQTVYLNAAHIISISVEEEDDRESRWNRRKK